MTDDDKVSEPQDDRRHAFRVQLVNTMLPTVFMIGLLFLLATMQWAQAGSTTP